MNGKNKTNKKNSTSKKDFIPPFDLFPLPHDLITPKTRKCNQSPRTYALPPTLKVDEPISQKSQISAAIDNIIFHINEQFKEIENDLKQSSEDEMDQYFSDQIILFETSINRLKRKLYEKSQKS